MAILTNLPTSFRDALRRQSPQAAEAAAGGHERVISSISRLRRLLLNGAEPVSANYCKLHIDPVAQARFPDHILAYLDHEQRLKSLLFEDLDHFRLE